MVESFNQRFMDMGATTVGIGRSESNAGRCKACQVGWCCSVEQADKYELGK